MQDDRAGRDVHHGGSGLSRGSCAERLPRVAAHDAPSACTKAVRPQGAAGRELRGTQPDPNDGARQDDRRVSRRDTPRHRECRGCHRYPVAHDGLQPGECRRWHRRVRDAATCGRVLLHPSVQLPVYGSAVVHSLRASHWQYLHCETLSQRPDCPGQTLRVDRRSWLPPRCLQPRPRWRGGSDDPARASEYRRGNVRGFDAHCQDRLQKMRRDGETRHRARRCEELHGRHAGHGREADHRRPHDLVLRLHRPALPLRCQRDRGWGRRCLLLQLRAALRGRSGQHQDWLRP